MDTTERRREEHSDQRRQRKRPNARRRPIDWRRHPRRRHRHRGRPHDTSYELHNERLQMSPKPYDDLFIEPAGDYDVVYGDFNSTMDEGNGKRPYIRLNSNLPNVTRNAGGEVRLKCEAVGSPQPITFTWLKNHAPLEKSRRFRIRNREYWSKLVITDLDVLDSGYYQCEAANSAGSVNTTSVLRVNTAPPNVKPKPSHRPPAANKHLNAEYGGEDYENYFDEMERSRSATDSLDDLFQVPDSAAGAGFVPSNDLYNDRWLDGRQLKKGECIPYMGRACRNYLTGKYITITTENRDEMYDIDHHISAAMMFIQKMPNVSDQCKHYSYAVACYHKYKVCDQSSQFPSQNAVLSLCRSDCDNLTENVCPKEMAMAAQHELVGDGVKSLLPRCETLAPNAPHCIRVLQTASTQSVNPLEKAAPFSHWCYVDTGRKYEGTVSMTTSGKRCIPWHASPSTEFNPEVKPRLRKAGNHCRNPGGPIAQPWCYTSPSGFPEACDVQKCPPNIYTAYSDSAPETIDSTVPNESIIDSVSRTWQNLSPQVQMSALAGFGALLFGLFLLLVCCSCCCRKKKRKNGTSATTTTGGHSTVTSSTVNKNGYFIQSVNGGSSIANSAINAAYYQKTANMNGNMGLIPQSGYEMNSLLNVHRNGGPGSAVHSIGSHAYATAQQQPMMAPPYSPHTSTDQSEQYQIQMIHEAQLQIEGTIGEDDQHIVYLAEWAGAFIGGKSVKVAIQALRMGANQMEMAKFQEDIRSLGHFTHMNVVKLLGVTYLENIRLGACFDYSIHGDLIGWLKIRAPHFDDAIDERNRTSEDMLRISYQIAGGMEYLASMGFVHKDLAARNCLIADQLIVKIADFGKFMECYEGDYFRKNGRMRIPIRWMAPEALDNMHLFGQQTDVYSFGVTLWEIYTFGQQPFKEMSNQQLLEMGSFRDLQCPSGCPSNIYRMIVECCTEVPERRPRFAELHKKLQLWSALGNATMNRASSIHSGGSSGIHGSRQSSDRQSNGIVRGSVGGMLDQYAQAGVPSPAPTGQQTKLALLSNGNSIIHSTPIGLRSPRSRDNCGEDTNPLMRRKADPIGYNGYSSDEA